MSENENDFWANVEQDVLPGFARPEHKQALASNAFPFDIVSVRTGEGGFGPQWYVDIQFEPSIAEALNGVLPEFGVLEDGSKIPLEIEPDEDGDYTLTLSFKKQKNLRDSILTQALDWLARNDGKVIPAKIRKQKRAYILVPINEESPADATEE